MPSMNDVTIKKKDGTTDIVYNALSASGGDGSPAFWRQDTGAAAALPIGLRKSAKMWGVWNGPKTARVMKINFVHPYAVQDSTTTLYSAKDRCVFDGTVTLPQGIPMTEMGEFAYQLGNFLAATLIKQSMEACYPPT